MNILALFAIRFYQRVLSPLKGYRCAYAGVSGRQSCSALGYRAIRRHGIWRGLGLLDQRLEKCGIAYRRHMQPSVRAQGRQAGFIDCACDVPSGCDLPSSCDVPTGCDVPAGCTDALEAVSGCGSCSPLNACDAADACDSCDSNARRRKRKKRGDDEYVVIPVRGDRN